MAAAIEIINIMTPIRLSLVKKALLSLIAFGLMAAPCFADALLLTVSNTPYDRQMTPIHNVLTMTGSSGDHVSIGLVNAWIGDLRDIPYGYQPMWRTPTEVESRQPADCKGKAVALYQRMKAHGATNVRLVIGKRAPTSRKTHAWIEWETASGSYVLDPTFNYAATSFQKIHRNCYVPLYAYAGSKKFRAATATLVAQN
jgi:predicted transglutaminase-like cysteine proteinase